MAFAPRLLVCSLAFLSSACASASGGGAASAEACRSDLAPDSIALDSWLDSTRAQSALEAEWGTGQPALVLATVDYDSTFAFDEVRIHAQGLDSVARGSLSSAVEASLRSRTGVRRRSRLFVADTGGVALRSVEEFRTCAPQFTNRRAMMAAVQAEARGIQLPARPLTTYLMVFVNVDGTVGEVRIDDSSGNVNVDLAAGRVMGDARFRPASLEGILVPVWARFPVTFRRPSGL